MTSKLIALPYSPWSRKAKWALDHHHIAYRYVTHMPMLGEPLLRLSARKLTGRVTVPLFVTDGARLMDSWDIARWADAHGEGEPLVPPEHEDEIRAWNERSEAMLSAGRALLLEKMLASPAALAENVPGPRLGNLLAPIGALGTRFIASKHGAKGNVAAVREDMRRELAALDRALEKGDHLVGGRFSYADVAMALATIMLKPPGPGRDHLGDATRECWTQPELVAEFPKVLAWRDRIFDRKPRR
jgi:glutathione S-transferase